MGTYRGTELVIFLIFISSYKVSSQSFTLFGNTIVIDRNESVICKSALECVENSCNKGRVCIQLNDALVQYGIITCDEDSSTPYCNGGLCSKIPQPGCDPSALPFACPADGVFPDPTDCTRYHICTQGSLTTNQCPKNTVYDHVNNGCKYRRRLSDCVTFNCIGQEGRAIVYSADDRIYGRCILGKPLILGRCEDYERYDVSSEKCVRYCRTGGVQPPNPGPDSCRKYVLCAEVSPRKYEPVEMSCACNEGYDKELNGCKVNAACLENVIKPLCPRAKTNDLTTIADESGEDDNVSDSSDEIENGDQAILPLIINNAGDNNNNNKISNGDDNVDGNLVNGNDNGDNSNSGNVNKSSAVAPLIINNAGSNNNNNKISNGDDNVDGNLVNGNGNGDNSNSGNVNKSSSAVAPLIINNAGNNNEDNEISNGNDEVDGNLVNGNGNGDNSNSGNVDKSAIAPLIINNAGSNNTNNNITNGNDKIDGNLINGNGNGNNSNSGNIRKKGFAVVPLIINSSGSSNSNNSISNGDDNVEGNIVNGNDNGNNDNTGNINTDKLEPRPEIPRPYRSWIRILIDWIHWKIHVI